MRTLAGNMGRALLLVVFVPIVLLAIPVILFLNLFGLNKLSAGPDYLEDNLERFLAGTESPYNWDDFCSVPLKDAELDSIRERICDFGPWSYADDSREAQLRTLLDEVRALAVAKKNA